MVLPSCLAEFSCIKEKGGYILDIFEMGIIYNVMIVIKVKTVLKAVKVDQRHQKYQED